MRGADDQQDHQHSYELMPSSNSIAAASPVATPTLSPPGVASAARGSSSGAPSAGEQQQQQNETELQKFLEQCSTRRKAAENKKEATATAKLQEKARKAERAQRDMEQVIRDEFHAREFRFEVSRDL